MSATSSVAGSDPHVGSPSRAALLALFMIALTKNLHLQGCAESTQSTTTAPSTDAQTFDVDWVALFSSSSKTVAVAPGDKLRFTWTGSHNVYGPVTSACDGTAYGSPASFACPGTTAAFGASLGSASPVEYTVPTTANAGDYLCFACQVSSHCSSGQYIIVQVAQPAGRSSTSTLSR